MLKSNFQGSLPDFTQWPSGLCWESGLAYHSFWLCSHFKFGAAKSMVLVGNSGKSAVKRFYFLTLTKNTAGINYFSCSLESAGKLDYKGSAEENVVTVQNPHTWRKHATEKTWTMGVTWGQPRKAQGSKSSQCCQVRWKVTDDQFFPASDNPKSP